MKNYSEAIKSHKRVVDIGQQTLPPNYPNLQVYKKKLASVLKKEKKLNVNERK